MRDKMSAWRVIAAVLVAALAMPSYAAADVRPLAGWWIAIDNVFPALWPRGDVRPVEEILIVNPDGRVENRAMNFWSGSAEACANEKVCSDLPVIATARAAIKGNTLTFTERRTRTERIESVRGDPFLRAASVTASASWTLTRAGETMTLGKAGDAKSTRVFARVTPDRLRRLRAAMRITNLDPARHWRCFLAVATARETAFASLRQPSPTDRKGADRKSKDTAPGKDKAAAVAPALIESFLRIASYLASIDAMLRHPTMDDPEPAVRRLLAHEPEHLMVEDFKGVTVPASYAEKARLAAIAQAIDERVRPALAGATAQEAKDEARAAQAKATATGQPRLAVSEAELSALARVLGDDAEAKALFCRE